MGSSLPLAGISREEVVTSKLPMAYNIMRFAVFVLLASLTISYAQSADENTVQAPSWTWPYKQIYPPVSVNETAGGPRSIFFALMMSFGGNFNSSGTIPGVQSALDRINSDPTLLPGYKLHYTLTDSQVRAVHGGNKQDQAGNSLAS